MPSHCLTEHWTLCVIHIIILFDSAGLECRCESSLPEQHVAKASAQDNYCMHNCQLGAALGSGLVGKLMGPGSFFSKLVLILQCKWTHNHAFSYGWVFHTHCFLSSYNKLPLWRSCDKINMEEINLLLNMGFLFSHWAGLQWSIWLVLSSFWWDLYIGAWSSRWPAFSPGSHHSHVQRTCTCCLVLLVIMHAL